MGQYFSVILATENVVWFGVSEISLAISVHDFRNSIVTEDDNIPWAKLVMKSDSQVAVEGVGEIHSNERRLNLVLHLGIVLKDFYNFCVENEATKRLTKKPKSSEEPQQFRFFSHFFRFVVKLLKNYIKNKLDVVCISEKKVKLFVLIMKNY